MKKKLCLLLTAVLAISMFAVFPRLAHADPANFGYTYEIVQKPDFAWVGELAPGEWSPWVTVNVTIEKGPGEKLDFPVYQDDGWIAEVTDNGGTEWYWAVEAVPGPKYTWTSLTESVTVKIRVQVPEDWTEECDHTFNVKLKPGCDSGKKSIGSGDGVHFKVCIKIPPAEAPSISIDKFANVTMAHVGDTIRYFYNVTNTGNVQLTDIYISDNVTGTINVPDTLDPNQWILVDYNYTVRATDPDPLVNNATVCAKYNGQEVSAWDTWTVDILHPAISVSKVANVTRAYAGDVIEYTINVTNVGDCPLYNVNITDKLLLEEPLTIEELGVGESKIFTLTYTVMAGDPDPLENTVTVEGKDALGLVVSADASTSVDLIAKICGYKFYDANVNGKWDDDGEPGVKGIKIQLFKDGEYINEIFTDENGCYCFDELDAGNYTIVEVLPNNWVNTTSTSISVELKSGEISKDNNFGNVCLKPGYGGKTLGYWANAGNKLINSSDVNYLNTLNLYKPNVWDYPPFSGDINTARTQIRNYLLSANAKDMKWMLSAQLIATALNVRHGYLSDSTIVYVGPSTYVPSGFISIGEIIEKAKTALAGDSRSEQAYWKNILDWLNNNKLYFVCPEPCYPIEYE